MSRHLPSLRRPSLPKESLAFLRQAGFIRQPIRALELLTAFTGNASGGDR
jgi:hypothetical protein